MYMVDWRIVVSRKSCLKRYISVGFESKDSVMTTCPTISSVGLKCDIFIILKTMVEIFISLVACQHLTLASTMNSSCCVYSSALWDINI